MSCLIIKVQKELEVSMKSSAQLKEIIQSHKFRTNAEFNSDPNCLLYLPTHLSNMPITAENIHLAHKIVQKYKLPVLPHFSAFFQRLTPVQQELYHEELSHLIQIIYQIIGDHNFTELHFLPKRPLQTDKHGAQTQKRLIQLSEEDRTFVHYCHQLSSIYHSINQIIAKSSGLTFSKMSKVTSLYERFEWILHKGTYFNDYEHKTLQNYHVNILRKKVYTGVARANQLFEQLLSNQIVSLVKDKYSDSESDTEEKSSSEDEDRAELRKLSLKEQNSNFTHICCRRFFKQGALIFDPKVEDIDILNLAFPFGCQGRLKIKQQMCSLINGKGGILIINSDQIEENDQRIFGTYMSQNDKEEIIKEIRQAVQTIQPDIITSKLYLIDFVPVASQQGFIEGKFATRIKIKFGNREQIYSYKEKDEQSFIIRSHNSSKVLTGREMMRMVKERLLNPAKTPPLIHPGPCLQPFEGCIVNTGPRPFKRVIQDPKEKEEQRIAGSTGDSRQCEKVQKKTCFNSTLTYLLIGVDFHVIKNLLDVQGIYSHVLMEEKENQKILIQIKSEADSYRVRKVISNIPSKLQSCDKSYRLVPITKYIEILKVRNKVEQFEAAKKILTESNISYFSKMQKGQLNGLIKFEDLSHSAEGFLILEKNELRSRFVPPL